MSQTAGQRWSKEATEEQLDGLAELTELQGRMLSDVYTTAELAYFAIAGIHPDDFDRDEAARFWEPYGEIDDYFVEAFIDGALSAIA